MAQKSGWFKKLAATIAALSKEAWLVFWGINNEDKVKEVAEKMAKTASKGVGYNLVDNLLTLLSPVTVGFFKWLGWEDAGITVIMWIEDVIIAYGLILFSRSVVRDFTLAEASRASIDSIRKNGQIGRIIANSLTIGLMIKFSLWDGPERVAIFFHKELPGKIQELLVVMAFAVIQAIFWTKLYSLGIDGLVNIWRLFF